ncbi:MAG: OB-fold nucleic acid binding domain-containing protein, partial [Panacibacter sp.]
DLNREPLVDPRLLELAPQTVIREKLNQLHITPTSKLASAKNGDLIKVAGLVLVRQRPGTAGGICFMTIEDETGVANLVIFPNLFELFRKEILQSKLIMAEGTLQIEGEVIHVIVQRCYNFSKLLRQLTTSQQEDPQVLTLAYADEKSIPAHAQKKRIELKETQEEKIFPGARNFK